MTGNSSMCPPGWVTAQARDVCEKIQDGTHFSPKVQLPEGLYRYVTAKNVRSSGLDLRDISFLRPNDHRAIYARCDTRKGDVLLVKDGVNTGDVALNTLDDEISLLSSVCFLRPDRLALLSTFLRYFLMSPSGQLALTGRMTGTAIKRIVLHRIKETVVPVAPMSQQEQIVEALDEYLSRLDTAVASLERVQGKLKAYRASVLKAAVEGRLVPTEASLAHAEKRNYEPAAALLARILKERRRRWEEAELARLKAVGKSPKVDRWKARYEDPIGPDTSALPELAEGWAWTLCAQVLLRLQTGPFGSSIHRSDYVTGGTPVINPQHLKNYGIHPSDDVTVSSATVIRLSVFRLAAGDIILGRRGEMGRCALVGVRESGWLLGTGSLALRPVEGVEGAYLTWVLRSPRTVRTLEGESVGTTMTNLNQEILFGLPVPLPPVAEQVRISQEIERHISIVENLEVIVAKQQARCDRARQALLKWAFEGKLVDQDPTDGPAEALLARIRAERAAANPGNKKNTRRRTKGAA